MAVLRNRYPPNIPPAGADPLLREGRRLHGGYSEGSGSGVYIPPYDFFKLYGVFDCRFCISFSQKRLELKSLKEQTKAAEEGPPGPFLLSLRLPLQALWFEPFLRKKTHAKRRNRGCTAEGRTLS